MVYWPWPYFCFRSSEANVRAGNARTFLRVERVNTLADGSIGWNV